MKKLSPDSMLEKLINTDFTKESPDLRLIKLGIPITPSPDEHHMVSIRQGNKYLIYGFKLSQDHQLFATFLMQNQISFIVPEASIGARYSYHIGLVVRKEEPINVASFTPDNANKTYYTPETLQEALELVKTLKNITVRSQDYHTSAYLRDMEKHFTEKIEQDKKRTI